MKAVIGSAGLRIAGMGFGFLVGVQLARGLGAEGYGVYGLAMSIIAVLTVPIQFGLPQLIIREVAAGQAKAEWGRIRGVILWSNQTVARTSLLVAICVVVGLLISGERFDSALSRCLLAGLIMLPLVAIGGLRGAVLLGLQRAVSAQFPNVLLRPAAHSLLLLLVPLLITGSLDPTLAMGLGALSAAIVVGTYAWLMRRALPVEVKLAVPVVTARDWRRSALPMALTEGMRVLQGHLVTLLMGLITTIAVVGLFRVANSVVLLIAMPISMLNIVCSPMISKLHAQGDHPRLQRMLVWVSVAMVLGVLVLAMPFLIAGGPLLAMVFGAEFAASNLPLLVLCAGTLANACFGLNSQVLNMTGHEQRVTRAFALSLVLLILIGPPLVYTLQAMGAALASSISLLLWNVLMWHDARVRTGLDTTFFSIFRRSGSHDD